jgi:hypothetical protein
MTDFALSWILIVPFKIGYILSLVVVPFYFYYSFMIFYYLDKRKSNRHLLANFVYFRWLVKKLPDDDKTTLHYKKRLRIIYLIWICTFVLFVCIFGSRLTY